MNNDDGIGNDPSFAIDDIELSVNHSTCCRHLRAQFQLLNLVFRMSDVLRNPSTWTWSSERINSPQVVQSCTLCLYSGTFPCWPEYSNGSNSVTNNIAVTVTSRPCSVSTTDSVLCQGGLHFIQQPEHSEQFPRRWEFSPSSPSTNASTPPSICYSHWEITVRHTFIKQWNLFHENQLNNYITVNSPSTPTISVEIFFPHPLHKVISGAIRQNKTDLFREPPRL